MSENPHGVPGEGLFEGVIEQYRAGLEAELTILRGLQRLATRQREATYAHDLSALGVAADERDRLMEALVAVEGPLRQIRKALSEGRAKARQLPGYADALAMHAEAVALVTAILSTDDESVAALSKAELARKDAARATEQGETTLAAYRRVMKAPTGATLVDRRG